MFGFHVHLTWKAKSDTFIFFFLATINTGTSSATTTVWRNKGIFSGYLICRVPARRLLRLADTLLRPGRRTAVGEPVRIRPTEDTKMRPWNPICNGARINDATLLSKSANTFIDTHLGQVWKGNARGGSKLEKWKWWTHGPPPQGGAPPHEEGAGEGQHLDPPPPPMHPRETERRAARMKRRANIVEMWCFL